MSKISKLIQTPKFFFKDMIKKRSKKQQIKLDKNKISQENYLNTILDLKIYLAIEKIKYEGNAFWPFLRNELMVFTDICFNKQIKGSLKFNPYQTQLCNINKENYEKFQVLAEKENFYTVESLEKEDLDFVFFTNLNSTDEVSIEGKRYNRLIDPLYDISIEMGKKSKKIKLVKAITPALDFLEEFHNQSTMIIPDFTYENNNFIQVDFPTKMIEKIKKSIPFIDIDENRLNSFVDWQIHMIDFYTKLLKKLNPKVVFFHPYYYYTPLIYAANRMEILTVDIQHGIMHGFNEVFYDNYQESKNSSAMPKKIMVWSKKEGKHLNSKFGDNISLVTGYPWLDYVNTLTKPKKEDYIKKINERLYMYDMKIVLTLQKDSFIPEWAYNLFEETKNNILWIIRKHPKGKSIHLSTKYNNVLIGEFYNNLTLNIHFEIVDFNFTPGSTTVLEADYYKCKSYIYSEEGYLNYKDYIEAGTVGEISSSIQSIYDIHLSSNLNNYNINYFEQVNIKQILESLLKSS